MKKGYKENIEKLTLENSNFRKVLYTAHDIQLVLMSLKPKEEIGFEIHEENDQFFRFEQGEGIVFVNEIKYLVQDGDVVVVPAGAKHNVVNSSENTELKFYTIYSPSHHRDGVVRETKESAEKDSPEFDGITSE